MNYNISQKNDLSTFFLSVQAVSDYIENKTAVDDHRHSMLVKVKLLLTCCLQLFKLSCAG